VIEFWGEGSKNVAGPFMLRTSGALKETSFLYLNCGKAIRELGWCSMFSFREAVRQTVEWYRRAMDGENVWELTKSQIDAYAMNEAWAEAAVR